MARGARGFVHMLSHFRLAVQRWQCHRTKYKAANQRSSGATGLTGITQWNGRCNEYLFIRGQFLLPRSNECRIITRRQVAPTSSCTLSPGSFQLLCFLVAGRRHQALILGTRPRQCESCFRTCSRSMFISANSVIANSARRITNSLR